MTLAAHVARQLWIRLRLIGILSLPAVAAVLAVTVDGQIDSAAGRLALAIGFAVAAVLCAALVGIGFAEEIESGSAGWLVVRAVPRKRLIGAWLTMPTAAAVVGFALAGILAGLAIPSALSAAPDPILVVVSLMASAAPALPLTAAGLAIAVDAPPRVAFAATIGGAAVLAVPILLLGATVVHPASGYWLVAGIAPGDRPITIGLEAIGLCLLLTAAIWLLAARRFEGRDL